MIDRLRIPICAKCGLTMRCVKNERNVREEASQTEALPEVPVWSGDEFRCNGCGARVIVGFGMPHLYPQGKIPQDTLEYRHEP